MPAAQQTSVVAGGSNECTCNLCQPHLYSIHRHAADARLGQVGIPAGLVPASHEPLLVVNVATRRLGRLILDNASEVDRAVSAYQHWHDHFAESLEVYNLKDDYESAADIFQQPFTNFNGFFFNDAIQGAVFRWTPSIRDTAEDDMASCLVSRLRTRALFSFRPIRVCESKGLTLDQEQLQRELNESLGDVTPLVPRIDELVGDLLHEMVHAFLDQYACDGSSCRTEVCKELAKFNLGRTNHGRAWTRMASLLDAVAVGLFGVQSEDYDAIGLWAATDVEAGNGGPRPSVCDVRGLSFED